MDSPQHTCTCSGAKNRRGFLTQAVAIVAGGFALLVPAAISLFAWLNPLRQKCQTGEFPLTKLDDLPIGGEPRKFSIIADRTDAWNRFPNEPIGTVFLRRPAENEVEAFQAECPHAGCLIHYQPPKEKSSGKEGEGSSEDGKFFCACHSAFFGLGGGREIPSPSPRDMDSLEWEIRDGEVWVKFQEFKTGTAEKQAKA